MRWSYRIGRIAGIPVQIHVTFLFLLVGAALYPPYFGADAPLAAVTRLLFVFACVVLHELGHALTARRYGIATRDITLLPIGGIARLERMPEQPSQELVVALAGPAVNVVIAALLWLVSHGLSQEPLDAMIRGGLLRFLFAVNVIMILFNLIPAFPMDGGRVLRALIAMRLPYERATRIASGVGQFIALLFAIAGLFVFRGNMMLVLIALFVFIAAGEERTIVQTRVSIQGLPVRAAMVTEFHQLDVNAPLSLAVEYLMAGSQQDFPVMQDGTPLGVLTRDQLLAAIARHGASVPVSQVVLRPMSPLDPDAPLEAALARMRETGQAAVPVAESGRLVGLLTSDNVGDLLLVRQALRRYMSNAAT